MLLRRVPTDTKPESELPMNIQWFERRDAFLAAAEAEHAAIIEHDIPIAQSVTFDGYCQACHATTTFKVNAGPMFGDRPNLREGLRCERCSLSTRQRLMFAAMHDEIQRFPNISHGAMLEQTTSLHQAVRGRWPWLIGSEFLGDRHTSGRRYWWSPHWRQWRQWQRIRHESITSLSYASDSLDLLVHTDVLEHVYDTRKALGECSRVLREGGVMLFTVPFFIAHDHSLLRGRPSADGRIEHLEPPEYHGDGVRLGGIYTFHHLGWDLFDRLNEAGFARTEIGFCHAPAEAITAADPADRFAWCTLPIILRAIR